MIPNTERPKPRAISLRVRDTRRGPDRARSAAGDEPLNGASAPRSYGGVLGGLFMTSYKGYRKATTACASQGDRLHVPDTKVAGEPASFAHGRLRFMACVRSLR